jgi:hypothetical protein
MDSAWKAAVWPQFAAAIDMLGNAINACPDDLWSDRTQRPQFWYLAYHTVFFLDLYLSGSVEGFTPPKPFTLNELDPSGVVPEQPYSKPEVASYLEQCRSKCRVEIEAMTDERARRQCTFAWVDCNLAELMLYNMRHVQHGAAQLHLILRQQTNSAPGWVKRAV